MTIDQAKYQTMINAGVPYRIAAILADPAQSGSPGGGSMSITDGTTTVNPATSLHLPAGTLTDLGAGEGGVGLITTLVGPYHIDFTHADMNSGVMALGPALPDGAVILAA